MTYYDIHTAVITAVIDVVVVDALVASSMSALVSCMMSYNPNPRLGVIDGTASCQVKAIVAGSAGWGKSRSIHALRTALGHTIVEFVHLLGVRYYRICLRGSTESTLHLTFNKSLKQDNFIKMNNRDRLQSQLDGMTYMIIDEYGTGPWVPLLQLLFHDCCPVEAIISCRRYCTF